MWFLPLLVIGAIVIAAASRSPREAPPQRQLVAGAAPTGPIVMLSELVRSGQAPPPIMILCAIAEAEAIGRDDLASDIIRAFVAPVVRRHALATASLPLAPLAQLPYAAPDRPVRHDRGSCEQPSRSPRDLAASATPQVLPAAVVPQLAARPTTDAEIRAMLNTDPEGFIAMMTRSIPVIDVPLKTIPLETLPAAVVDVLPASQPVGLPSEAVAQMQEAAGLHEAADQTRALAPGSPLAGVPDDAWREFVMRLERESPLLDSSRHVGQYRQRRERLADLGIDPSTLVGSAQAQRAALDTDLFDAYQHASDVDDGFLDRYVGRPITIPGRDDVETVTLSGALGVIQCAGLDNGLGWLERLSDRKRYPHTTQAFLHTNGVF